MSAFNELINFQCKTEALCAIASRLGWDQETVMPRGAAIQRGEEIAAIESVLHARRSDKRLGDWLDAINFDDLVESDQAKVHLIRRSYERTVKVPAELATEIARVTSVAQGIWAEARANEDFDSLAPTLEQVVKLRREEAAALANGGNLYDALLDDYEPYTSGKDVEMMFSAMRPRLVALRERILSADKQPTPLVGTFAEQDQLALSKTLAHTFGYDFERGRIDRAVHPFSSGSGSDVRITTRTSPHDPFDCLYSTIHEVGHACYEQNILADYAMTPLGRGVSMGVHESQSRFYENQLGRGRAFSYWLFERMKETFGDFGVPDAAAFYATVNRVNSDFIRTAADEIHYNLHILLRFDLERQLVTGELAVADLPDSWNQRFKADFGVSVDKPSNGVLQDVHWPIGLFGYFPTYTLGNVYAACLLQAMRTALPNLDDELTQGHTGTATDWLRENLQQYGALRRPQDTIAHACGFEPTVEPLLTYLEDKFSDIYEL